jgi:hypothetical protein
MALDSSEFITVRKNSNREDMIVSTVLSDHSIVNATVKSHLYDYTTIQIKNVPGLNLSSADAMNRIWLSILDRYDGELTEFCLGTRLDSSGNPVDSLIFYDRELLYDSDSDTYSINVVIPAKCSSGSDTQGFNESIATVSIAGAMDGKPIEFVKSYIANLPPLLLQVKPEKKSSSEEDPVFPESANRCDIGSGKIPSYYDNAMGYSRDYLFTDGSPRYLVKTRGLIPYELRDSLSFSNVSGYVYDDRTGSANYLNTVESGSPSTVNMTVMSVTDGNGSSQYMAKFYRKTWKSDLDSQYARQNGISLSNVFTVSATIVEV